MKTSAEYNEPRYDEEICEYVSRKYFYLVVSLLAASLFCLFFLVMYYGFVPVEIAIRIFFYGILYCSFLLSVEAKNLLAVVWGRKTFLYTNSEFLCINALGPKCKIRWSSIRDVSLEPPLGGWLMARPLDEYPLNLVVSVKVRNRKDILFATRFDEFCYAISPKRAYTNVLIFSPFRKWKERGFVQELRKRWQKALREERLKTGAFAFSEE